MVPHIIEQNIKYLLSILNNGSNPILKTSIINNPPNTPIDILSICFKVIFLDIIDANTNVINGFVVVTKTPPLPAEPKSVPLKKYIL